MIVELFAYFVEPAETEDGTTRHLGNGRVTIDVPGGMFDGAGFERIVGRQVHHLAKACGVTL